MRDIDESEMAATRRRGSRAAAESPRPRLGRVLVAEDEADVAELIRHHLTKDGYDVVLATTGAEALKRARDEKPDVILLDVMIPQMNGWEVCRCLKREPQTAGTPVIRGWRPSAASATASASPRRVVRNVFVTSRLPDCNTSGRSSSQQTKEST